MEFNEKLQFFRKKSGLTQEQLAEKLNISRTAVSKWESGRGFPNIEALKNISKVFQVPIDDLLSGEELITIAESDNAAGLDKVYSLAFGVLDLLALALIFLPLYSQNDGGYIRTVSLIRFSSSPSIKAVFFILLAMLALMGAVEIAAQFFDDKKGPPLRPARFYLSPYPGGSLLYDDERALYRPLLDTPPSIEALPPPEEIPEKIAAFRAKSVDDTKSVAKPPLLSPKVTNRFSKSRPGKSHTLPGFRKAANSVSRKDGLYGWIWHRSMAQRRVFGFRRRHSSRASRLRPSDRREVLPASSRR